MAVLKVILEFIVVIVALAIVILIIVALIGGKDILFDMFGIDERPLYATRGAVELQCGGTQHTFSVTELGVHYTGKESKLVFPVIMWGNKVKAPEQVNGKQFVVLNAEDDGRNVYSFDLDIRFDEDAGEEPIPPPTYGEVKIFFFEKNNYCRDLALQREEREEDDIKKYDTDINYFTHMCAGLLEGSGALTGLGEEVEGERIPEPITLDCGSNNRHVIGD
ncbi:hypothetical protein ACFLQN_03525 [Candidatus Aenigmatarchaeota archaeon]